MTLRSLHADLHQEPISIDVLFDREHPNTMTVSFMTPSEDFVELCLSDDQARQLLEQLQAAQSTFALTNADQA